MSRKPLVAGLILLLLGSASGCSISLGPLANGVQLKARSKSEIVMKDQDVREIAVDSHHGSIRISASDGPEIKITADLQAAEEADLKNISVEAKSEAGVAKIGWKTTDGSFDNRQVTLEIKAPASLVLRLKTGAGEISAQGFKSGLNARTNAGSIKSDSVSGALDLQTQAGEISVKNALGKVIAQTSAGSVKIDGTLKGDSKAETGAGSVEIRLAQSNHLKIDAETSAGKISNDFGWTAKGQVSAAVKGELGDGSQGSLRIRTGAGSIEIDRLP